MSPRLVKNVLLRPFQGPLSWRSCSPSHQLDNTTVSISASPPNSYTSVPQVNPPRASHQGAPLVILHNTTVSISASPTDDATPVPQALKIYYYVLSSLADQNI